MDRFVASPVEGPLVEKGRWSWRGVGGNARVLFLGRRDPSQLSGSSPVAEGERVERLLGSGATHPAWLEQVHSSDVVEARPGNCGPGDALVTGTRGLALSVVTADCVPVLLSTGRQVAAIHAGWRGIVSGVVGRTAERLGVAENSSPPGDWCAWIGPAIGGCCYEVGPEVAERVVAASTPAALLSGAGERPHLDLAVAVLAQLAAAGVGLVRPLIWCTRCESERLHSYRREGAGGGRNRALIWRVE